MNKKIIYEIKGLYRDNFRVTGYEFGTEKKAFVLLERCGEMKCSSSIAAHSL